MARHPKIHTYSGRNYSTNCIRLHHEQCSNYFGRCECGCHAGKYAGDFDSTIKEFNNKLAREKYENMSDIGKWDHN